MEVREGGLNGEEKALTTSAREMVAEVWGGPEVVVVEEELGP